MLAVGWRPDQLTSHTEALYGKEDPTHNLRWSLVFYACFWFDINQPDHKG